MTEAISARAEQRALIIWQHGNDNNVTELNELLREGWRLVSLNRMGGWCQAQICALAVVEREGASATNGVQ